MSIIVERFLIAELVSVEKLSDMEYLEWKWREGFLGFQSTLTIYESTQNFKGKRFIVFNDFSGNCLSTGFGEYTITDDELVSLLRRKYAPCGRRERRLYKTCKFPKKILQNTESRRN